MPDPRMIPADEARGTLREVKEPTINLAWSPTHVGNLAHTVVKQAAQIERVRDVLHRIEQADEQAQHDWDTKADMFAQGAAMAYSMAAQWLEEALEDTDAAAEYAEDQPHPKTGTGPFQKGPHMTVWTLPFTGEEPTRAHPDDAGLDLRAAESVKLAPLQRHLTPTGTHINIPVGHVGYLTPRSGLAHKHGVTILNAPGTIDAGYVGEVMVNLINRSDKAVTIHAGDRVAQLVVHQATQMHPVKVDHLATTTRGTNGHGSTGA